MISPEQITQRGEEIYQANKVRLERDALGQYVAIHVESGDLFIATSPEEAARQAKEKYPGSVTFLTRIGPDRGVFTIRSYRGNCDSWPLNFRTVAHH